MPDAVNNPTIKKTTDKTDALPAPTPAVNKISAFGSKSVKDTPSIIPAANPNDTDNSRLFSVFEQKMTTAPKTVDNPASEEKNKARTDGSDNISPLFSKAGTLY